MKRFFVLVVILVGLVALVGCSQKKVAQQSDTASDTQVEPVTDKDRLKPGDKPTGRELPRDTITERPLDKGKPGEGLGSVEELQIKIKDIYFDYDRYDIREDAKPVLKEIAGLLSRTKDVKLIIEGHCDSRGTNEYNLALGDRRAKSAKDYLVSLGIPSNRIEVVSYGEEKPLCTEENDECWAKNRRAHFVVIRETR
jgi:peptidoglycan-associated lipoprotein